MSDRGLYLLILRLEKGQAIKIGRFKETYFKAGYYFYVGRARRGLRARIERHLRVEKKTFWHIDYFARYARIYEVLVKPEAFDECETVRKLRQLINDSTFPLLGFGASDCCCCGHLLSLPPETDLSNLIEILGSRMGFQVRGEFRASH